MRTSDSLGADDVRAENGEAFSLVNVKTEAVALLLVNKSK